MKTKLKLLAIVFFISLTVQSQEENPTQQFWNTLQSHCNKAYEGTLELPKEDKDFGVKKL